MQDYQQHALEEKAELDARLNRLLHFIASDRYDLLPTPERLRLQQQSTVMKRYSEILAERITAFRPSP